LHCPPIHGYMCHRGRFPQHPDRLLEAGPGNPSTRVSDPSLSTSVAIGVRGSRGPRQGPDYETHMTIELHTLTKLTPAGLREEWANLGIRGNTPHFKQALVRGLSWHLQKQAHGGLDADTRRLLKAATRNAPTPASNESVAGKRKQRDPFQLPEGTTLVRTWRGHHHEVTVLEDSKRFRYRQTEYASLSEIAREITGARWSGPRFFGVKKLRQAS